MCSCILLFSLFRWRPGCTERALPASQTLATPSAPSMTNVSSCISMLRPEAEILSSASPPLLWKPFLAIWSWGSTKVHQKVLIFCPHCVTFTQSSTQCFSSDMHLTNVAIQKTAPDYDPESVRSSKPTPVLLHCTWNVSILKSPLCSPKVRKWTVQHLRRYLTAKHGRARVGTLFEDIDNIFVCSLQSVQKVIINDKHCFELYGYDILLDENLKP